MKLREYLLAYLREIILFVLISLFLTVALVWNELRPSNYYVQLVLGLILLGLGIAIYLLSRNTWRGKYRRPFILKARKVIIGASRFIMRILGRFNLFSRRGNVLSGRTSVHYDLSVLSRETRRKRKKSEKPLRWRDMESSRQKLGFLYYKLISGYIKHGARITSHETPAELRARFNENEAETELFDFYISTRYDERREPNEDKDLELKEKLFD